MGESIGGCSCVDVLVASVEEGAGDERAEVHQGLRVVSPAPSTHQQALFCVKPFGKYSTTQLRPLPKQ